MFQESDELFTSEQMQSHGDGVSVPGVLTVSQCTLRSAALGGQFGFWYFPSFIEGTKGEFLLDRTAPIQNSRPPRSESIATHMKDVVSLATTSAKLIALRGPRTKSLACDCLMYYRYSTLYTRIS